MIEAKPLSRSFSYNGVKLPDPDPRMTASGRALWPGFGGRGEDTLQPSISRISNGCNYRTTGVGRADAIQLRESYRDEGVAAKPAGIRSAKIN